MATQFFARTRSATFSSTRYDIRKSVDKEDRSLTTADYATPGILKDYPDLLPAGQTGLLVGTVYAQYLSPFAEMVVTGNLPQTREATTSKNNPLQSRGDVFQVSVSDLKKLVGDFFKQYGKKFRRCVWKIFATDSRGESSNIATVMATPSSLNFPYENVSFSSQLSAALGAHTDGSITFRTKYRSSTLSDGTQVSGREQFFRTLAH